jgi:predicted ATPase
LGENAPFLYDNEKDNLVANASLLNPQTDTFYTPEQAISIEKAIDFWFSYMGIKGFKNEEFKSRIYLSLNSSPYDQTEIDISQVGFGVSQMFPILLEGLRMPVGGTLLLEQPEIHLHPNLQMQMADFLLSLAHSGKGVIAETHSDHIVNRLVRRIVEDETGTLKDMIAIYFIRPSDDGAICEPVEIDDTRGIVNWPKDFFDQAANEQMRIMQAGLKKRRNLKNNPK